MPRIARTRRIAAAPQDVWDVVADPHHLPRWWPRVQRVEGVEGVDGVEGAGGAEGAGERWTNVFTTRKGRSVRADFVVVESSAAARRRTWRQELEGSPFERLMSDALTEVRVAEAGGGAADVTIEQRHRLRGLARLGFVLVRRATGRVLDEALDGLEAICGR
jgi:uncharacterized protein YndB with AHSA1/START domain